MYFRGKARLAHFLLQDCRHRDFDTLLEIGESALPIDIALSLYPPSAMLPAILGQISILNASEHGTHLR